MTSLKSKLLAAMEFDQTAAANASVDEYNISAVPIYKPSSSHWSFFVDGARWQHSRDRDLLEKMAHALEVADEALKQYAATQMRKGGPVGNVAFEARRTIEELFSDSKNS